MMKLDIGSSKRPARGERICGDDFVIFSNHEETIIALADGLGHGPKAAEAAQAFCHYVEECQIHSLEEIIAGAHAHIRSTRGTVAGIVRINANLKQIEFSGVGNIELKCISQEPICPVSMPGIIGHRLHKTKLFSYKVNVGDLFILFSDGISSKFELEKYSHFNVQQIADAVLQDYEKYYDDRTCIVIRCS
ncbi:SpoIIE family protein phosphatase [candidate division CSSED10-310 bacterium]|uniref:SpoIIE family protein phosphatase n=1 Tax=candidate division CSSED10-310 bacterium TaxID=2855610 RepID=A0ABV6YVH0_UNCC1